MTSLRTIFGQRLPLLVKGLLWKFLLDTLVTKCNDLFYKENFYIILFFAEII